MPIFIVQHEHEPADCGTAFAAWRGVDSRLRGATALCTCRRGGHELWLLVEEPNADAARALLPPWLAARSTVTPAERVTIP